MSTRKPSEAFERARKLFQEQDSDLSREGKRLTAYLFTVPSDPKLRVLEVPKPTVSSLTGFCSFSTSEDLERHLCFGNLGTSFKEVQRFILAAEAAGKALEEFSEELGSQLPEDCFTLPNANQRWVLALAHLIEKGTVGGQPGRWLWRTSPGTFKASSRRDGADGSVRQKRSGLCESLDTLSYAPHDLNYLRGSVDRSSSLGSFRPLNDDQWQEALGNHWLIVLNDVVGLSSELTSRMVSEWITIRDSPVEDSKSRVIDGAADQGSPQIILNGFGQPVIVKGEEKPPLTVAQFNVIQALINAGGNGLSKEELDKKSGHTEARKILKAIAKLDEDWGSVISFPGTPGKRYRILNR